METVQRKPRIRSEGGITFRSNYAVNLEDSDISSTSTKTEFSVLNLILCKMIRDTEMSATKLLTLLEKVKAAPNKNLINEAQAEMKIIRDHMLRSNGIGDDPNFRHLVTQLARLVSIQIDKFEYAQSKELCKILYPFLTQIGEFEDVRSVLRDDCGLLKYLAMFLKMDLTDAERLNLMNVVVVTSRELVISWKAPYMVELINSTLERILAKPDAQLDLHLQFLINACCKNHSCVLILRGSPSYKTVWKVLKEKALTSKDNCILALISHLNYVTEIYIPSKSFYSGYETAEISLAAAINEHWQVDSFVKITSAVRQIVESACAKMRSVWEDDSVKATKNDSEEPENLSGSKYKLLELVTVFQDSLHKFVNENRDKLEDEIKESVLLISMACMVPFTTSSTEPALLRNCTAAAETARRILTSSSKPRMQLLAYKIILRVSELIFSNASIPKDKNAEFISLFKDVVKSLKIDPDTPLIGLTLEMHTVSLRLFSLLIIDHQVKDSVKQKLSSTTVLALFTKTIGGNSDQKLKQRLSVFAVELLNVIRVLRPEDLSTHLSNPHTLNHVSNCIRNGEEKEIARALLVISNLGLTSLNLVSRSLKRSQEVVLSTPQSQPESSYDGSADRLEIEMTDFVADRQKGSKSSTTSDLLAWCQIKSEVHQREKTMLSAHISQLNETIFNLNAALEKQVDFISRHIAENEQRDMEVACLQTRYGEAAKKADCKAKELDKEVASWKKEATEMAEANAILTAKVKKFEGEIEMLTNQVAGLQETTAEYETQLNVAKADIKTLNKKLQNLQQQLEQCQSKNTKLEDDIKLKENEIEQLHVTLAKRQKMIDAIQTILGPQFASQFD